MVTGNLLRYTAGSPNAISQLLLGTYLHTLAHLHKNKMRTPIIGNSRKSDFRHIASFYQHFEGI